MSKRHPTVDESQVEPLSERFAGYLAVFGIGGGAAVVVGIIVFAVSGGTLAGSVGYTFVALGTLLLLVGGTRGGGYSNLGMGAVDAVIGRRNRSEDDFSDPEARRDVNKQRDPMERLRKGLRPAANPTAFWQAIAGFAYIGAGAWLVLSFG